MKLRLHLARISSEIIVFYYFAQCQVTPILIGDLNSCTDSINSAKEGIFPAFVCSSVRNFA